MANRTGAFVIIAVLAVAVVALYYLQTTGKGGTTAPVPPIAGSPTTPKTTTPPYSPRLGHQIKVSRGTCSASFTDKACSDEFAKWSQNTRNTLLNDKAHPEYSTRWDRFEGPVSNVPRPKYIGVRNRNGQLEQVWDGLSYTWTIDGFSTPCPSDCGNTKKTLDELCTSLFAKALQSLTTTKKCSFTASLGSAESDCVSCNY